MHRRKRAFLPPIFRQRLLHAFGAGLVLATLPVTFSGYEPVSPSAYAQQSNRATQVLFLAVDKNDLPGVQAAINGGADINARDFNGMQAVDLAIERGYFDIAHYLISVRNQLEAKGGVAKPTPTPEQLAQAQQDNQRAKSPSQTTQPPAPKLPPGTPNPFDAPTADDGLPVIGTVREPATVTAREDTPAPVAPPQATALQDQAPRPSAAKTFVTTFLDFFGPPNTTGIVRKDSSAQDTGADLLTDVELNKEIQQIEAELGDAPIKGPAVPMSPDQLAQELPPAPELPPSMEVPVDVPLDTPPLPPYAVTAPGEAPTQRATPAGEDPFADLAVSDVTQEDTLPLVPTEKTPGAPTAVADAKDKPKTDLPFGGGADPDILAMLSGAPADSAPAPADPFASDPFATPAAPPDSDPFAAPPASDPFAAPPLSQDAPPDSVASVLQGLDEPKEVAPLKTHAAPPPGADSGTGAVIDPFATPAGEVDELAGLLEGIGETVASKPDGWDVKSIEGGTLPDALPVLADVTPTGHPLDGVELSVGANTVIGQPVGETRLKMMAEETIHKPCLQKGGPQTVFCVDKVSWPFELESDFLVDTIMYQGTRTIARYDAGHASYFHTLFNTGAFAKVVNYYIERFGQPTEKIDRAIAPLAQPRRDNPTYIWRTREPGTDTITTLEVREFDDARGSFPDTRRGVVLLYREHAGGIFPLLSQLELMVLKDSGAMDLAPKTPDSVW